MIGKHPTGASNKHVSNVRHAAGYLGACSTPIPAKIIAKYRQEDVHNEDQGANGVPARVPVHQDADGSRGLPDTFDLGARKNGRRIPAPKYSDKAERYFVDPFLRSACERYSFIHEYWGASDEAYKPGLSREVPTFIDRQLTTATLPSGKDPTAMSDRMTSTGEQLTRPATAFLSQLVMSTFVRLLPVDYSFVEQLLEEQQPDRDKILELAKAWYNSRRSHPNESALVARGKVVRTDPDKDHRFTYHEIAHTSRSC